MVEKPSVPCQVGADGLPPRHCGSMKISTSVERAPRISALERKAESVGKCFARAGRREGPSGTRDGYRTPNP